MEHLKTNLVRKPFTREALKTSLWLLSGFKVFPGSTQGLAVYGNMLACASIILGLL